MGFRVIVPGVGQLIRGKLVPYPFTGTYYESVEHAEKMALKAMPRVAPAMLIVQWASGKPVKIVVAKDEC